VRDPDDHLTRDNAIGGSTGYEYLHEGIDVLAARAPGLHGALLGRICGGRASTTTTAATFRWSPWRTLGQGRRLPLPVPRWPER